MKAITNGIVVTITNGTIESGTVLIDGGKITAVGADVAIPAGAEVIDAKGGYIMPGLIDVHTHLMGFPGASANPLEGDFNETTDPITPHIRALDALNPHDICVEITRDAGFTTCYTGPGSANIIGGLGCAIKLRGNTAEKMLIPGTEHMKFAFGENPKRVYGGKGKAPQTRMAVAGILRETLTEAREYSESYKKYEEGKGDKPKFNAKSHALLGVIRGEVRCRLHCHRADDIMTAVRIAKEFKLDYTLEHATEGWKIADELAAEGVTCVIGPFMTGFPKREMWDLRIDNAAILERAGVNICLTEDSSTNTRLLPMHVGVAIREGLDEKAAFESVTIRPAKLMGLEGRVGSLEAGKDADVAVFNGHPFSNMTTCVLTMIDGEVYKNIL